MYDPKDEYVRIILWILAVLVMIALAAYVIINGSLDGIDGEQPINLVGEWIIKIPE